MRRRYHYIRCTRKGTIKTSIWPTGERDGLKLSTVPLAKLSRTAIIGRRTYTSKQSPRCLRTILCRRLASYRRSRPNPPSNLTRPNSSFFEVTEGRLQRRTVVEQQQTGSVGRLPTTCPARVRGPMRYRLKSLVRTAGHAAVHSSCDSLDCWKVKARHAFKQWVARVDGVARITMTRVYDH